MNENSIIPKTSKMKTHKAIFGSIILLPFFLSLSTNNHLFLCMIVQYTQYI